ncbi:Derlin 1 [Entophlyctis sp. JEL0112]|nr:Derlin 1 [Entophlyctis sp. JEL0112]
MSLPLDVMLLIAGEAANLQDLLSVACVNRTLYALTYGSTAFKACFLYHRSPLSPGLRWELFQQADAPAIIKRLLALASSTKLDSTFDSEARQKLFSVLYDSDKVTDLLDEMCELVRQCKFGPIVQTLLEVLGINLAYASSPSIFDELLRADNSELLKFVVAETFSSLQMQKVQLPSSPMIKIWTQVVRARCFDVALWMSHTFALDTSDPASGLLINAVAAMDVELVRFLVQRAGASVTAVLQIEDCQLSHCGGSILSVLEMHTVSKIFGPASHSVRLSLLGLIAVKYPSLSLDDCKRAEDITRLLLKYKADSTEVHSGKTVLEMLDAHNPRKKTVLKMNNANNNLSRSPLEEARAWFTSVPLVTRTIFAASLGLSIAAGAGVMSPQLLFLSWPKVYKYFELWRLVTCFLWHPLTYGYLTLLYFLYNYSWQLETSAHFDGRKADYLFFTLFSMGVILPLGIYMRQVILLEALVVSMLYVWSMGNKDQEVSFFFGLRFKAMFLPWVYIVFDFLTGAPFPPIPKLIGIFAGHLFYVLDTVYPENNNGARLISTPHFFYALMGEDPAVRGMGSVGGMGSGSGPNAVGGHRLGGGSGGSRWMYSGNGSGASNAGSGSGAATSGVRQRTGYNWGGSGHRLGSD